MRQFIPGGISIDGRMIEYRLVTAKDYLEAKEFSDECVEELIERGVYTIINQIMGLKQSCFLLRRVSHSCGSLAVDLRELKVKLITELSEKYDFEFDDEFVENYGF
jgi:hypothetical protein